MKKVVFLQVIFILLSFNNSFSQSVSLQEARTVAINLMSYESKISYTVDSIRTINTKIQNGNILLYEILFNNGTSVLLSGHKACTPVLGMTLYEEGEPSSGLLNRHDSLPDALQYLLDYYVNQIDYCFSHKLSPVFSIEWDSLTTYSNSSKNLPYRSSVSPLITTKWGQYKSNDGKQAHAYNYFIPGCDNYQHCFVGCVAVAMAQIMRFWHNSNEIPFTCTEYDWYNMPNKLNYRNNSNYVNERNAIATLMLDCANGVNMDFCSRLGNHSSCTTQQSGSNSYYASSFFKKTGFSNAVFLTRTDYSDETWHEMIRNNLNNGWPIQYRGTTSDSPMSEGHAFVCDGYKKKLFSSKYLYHFNWGWYGDSDGWFSIDNITPIIYYSYNQAAIFNIYPTSCYPNIVMGCDRTFTNGDAKTYATSGVFRNEGYDYIVNNRAYVTLYAGNEILLTDGFFAAEGSNFEAVIASCSSPQNQHSNIQENNDYLVSDTAFTAKSLQSDIVYNDETTLKVYPNPADDILNIELHSAGISSLTLFDLQGRAVAMARPITKNTVRLNISNFQSGVYLLQVIDTAGSTHRAKVVKR